MTEQCIPDLHDEDAAPLRGSQAPVVRLEALMPFTAPIGLLDRGVNLDSPRWRESSPEASRARHTWPMQATAEPDGRLVTTNQA